MNVPLDNRSVHYDRDLRFAKRKKENKPTMSDRRKRSVLMKFRLFLLIVHMPMERPPNVVPHKCRLQH